MTTELIVEISRVATKSNNEFEFETVYFVEYLLINKFVRVNEFSRFICGNVRNPPHFGVDAVVPIILTTDGAPIALVNC